jgi:hypothetical protein
VRKMDKGKIGSVGRRRGRGKKAGEQNNMKEKGKGKKSGLIWEED